MQFFSIIGPLAAIAGLASAVVIPQDPKVKVISQNGNLVEFSSRGGEEGKVANDADYKGLCFRDQSPFGTCGMCCEISNV